MTSVSAKQFAIALYLEHLEEASFLYEQHLGLSDDPELTWLDVEDFEDRFEPHIDGLVVGEELALEVCKQRAVEGDFGELHAAMRVFCRQKRLDLIFEVLEEIDPEDEESIKAVGDAFNDELPDEWRGDFIGLLGEHNEKLNAILPRLIGYRRIDAGKNLLHILEQNGAAPNPVSIWALGRLGDQQAKNFLFHKCLRQENEAVAREAALALLRMGEMQALQVCRQAAETQDWPIIFLGLGESRKVASFLLQIANSERVNADCLFALGLLGEASAVEALLAHLESADLAEAASWALNLITGAEIYEDVFIPEEIDEDELFEEELEKLKRGEPLYPSGEEPGTELNRLSQNAADWRHWWTQNQKNFQPGVCYRNGEPYSPASLLQNLLHERSPHRVRQLVAEEIVIRYGFDFHFEADMFVPQQKRALAKLAQIIEARGKEFEEGRWYFAGRLAV